MIGRRDITSSLSKFDWCFIAAAASTLMALAWLVLIVLPKAIYQRGVTHGQSLCVATSASQAVTSTVAAAAHVASQAQADIALGNTAATANEQAQTRIVTLYRTLESEARHVPSDPIADACVLPAERLRIWAAANAGPASAPGPADQGGAASQPHSAPASAAATDIGPAARSGAEPPPGGSGLPPTGSEVLRAAADPGDRAP